MINYFFLIPAVIALDLFLGEPKRWHPLIGFGWLSDKAESLRHYSSQAIHQFFLGVLAWCLLIIPLTVVTYFLEYYFGWWFSLIMAYLAIGGKSLRDHALQVLDALQQNDLSLARQNVGYIVSRDTATLDEQAISKSTIESVLENGSDAIFSALFWFLVAGAWGVVLYRLSNTLDAMWGYRNEKYEYFGKFSARIDDILNWIPARLTALSYLIVGNSKCAWQCWQQQAKHWYSPNAGVVMATGAGALNVQLGGAARYHGKTKIRPLLGSNRPVAAEDIRRSWQLVFNSMLLWAIVAIFIGLLYG